MTATLAQSHLSGIVLSNLMNIWNQSTVDERKLGRDWYANARRVCLNITSAHPLATTVGILAALSPGMEWTRNVEETARFIRSKGNGQYSVYGRANDDKARRILSGEAPLNVLGGPKVRAFYQCVMNPMQTHTVVIDSHMWCAGLNRTNDRWDKPSIRVTESRSWWLARHVIHCARQVGLYPCEFQAVVWLAWKRLMETNQ